MKISDNIMKYEAFVYLWFDSKNRMFYLGSHKGPEDDNYTHSSSIMESFSKKNIPSYMRRRILARGSYDDMTALEMNLLKNRKEKCWDRYYNAKFAVFPPPPKYGEDHPKYIDGRSSDPEYSRKKCRKYRENNREKVNAYQRKYRENNPEKTRERYRKYYKNNFEKERERHQKYYENNFEKERERKQKYYENNREKVREYNRKYYAKNKLEKSLQTA